MDLVCMHDFVIKEKGTPFVGIFAGIRNNVSKKKVAAYLKWNLSIVAHTVCWKFLELIVLLEESKVHLGSTLLVSGHS